VGSKKKTTKATLKGHIFQAAFSLFVTSDLLTLVCWSDSPIAFILGFRP
jgi:hypothetical protein